MCFPDTKSLQASHFMQISPKGLSGMKCRVSLGFVKQGIKLLLMINGETEAGINKHGRLMA